MRRHVLLVTVAALVLGACAGSEPSDVPEVSATPVQDDDEADDDDPADDDTEPDDTVDGSRSPLTGEALEPEVLDRPALQVKIENSPQARPQDGLEVADVVYEEVVEGGVTRFFAIFQSELPETAGPIRSARPVDTQLMGGYGASGFAYSGARAEVRDMLAATESIRVTEGGPGFYRDPSRHAPHNLYLRPPDTLAGVIERGAEPLGDVGWVFDDDPPAGALSCDEVADEDLGGDAADGDAGADGVDGAGSDTCPDPGAAIDIAMSRYFTTGWRYDADQQRYRRLQDGEPFLVSGEGRIGAATVLVLATRHYTGATGYPETDILTEDAPALVLRDGRRYEARWNKPTADAPVRVLTLDGEPFPFKPGPVWVHLPDASALPSTTPS